MVNCHCSIEWFKQEYIPFSLYRQGTQVSANLMVFHFLCRLLRIFKNMLLKICILIMPHMPWFFLVMKFLGVSCYIIGHISETLRISWTLLCSWNLGQAQLCVQSSNICFTESESGLLILLQNCRFVMLDK